MQERLMDAQIRGSHPAISLPDLSDVRIILPNDHADGVSLGFS